ncbi:hypothetical protein D1871_11610 [Nakamurella silvestris]|nr:hypothetical protein D1871_11610 [Nakamurella silvestris]
MCEPSELYDRGTGSFRVDPSWGVRGAVVCAYDGYVHVADQGIWRTTAEWDIQKDDLPALIELLNQRDIEPGIDDGFCGASSLQILGISLLLEDGSRKVFPQPQLGCTSGPENKAIVALAGAGTLRIVARSQERTELELALGCSREWEGGLDPLPTKGGRAITPPAGDVALCVYQENRRSSPLIAVGRTAEADIADLWASVVEGPSKACATPGKKWITIGSPRTEPVPTGWLSNGNALGLQPWAAIVEIGGCNRVFDQRARYLGTADRAVIAHVAGLADTPSDPPGTGPAEAVPDLSDIMVQPSSPGWRGSPSTTGG